MSSFLLPRVQAARKRLEIERVVESLDKATTNCTTVNDLSRLESIILDARKVFDEFGVEESDQRVYHSARALRGTLHSAAKIRQQLQSGTRTLQKQQRKVDAIAVEETIQRAAPYMHLLEDDAIKAQQALNHWTSIQKAEEHLNEVLQNAVESSEVSRAIHDATNTGAKTQTAKKILKLMQNIEGAMQSLAEKASSKGTQLRCAIEEGEKGGVGPRFIARARAVLNDHLAQEAKEILVSALEQDLDRDLSQRSADLRTALERASSVMERSFSCDPVALKSTTMHAADRGEISGGSLMNEKEEVQDLSEAMQSFWDTVHSIRDTIQMCESQMAQIKREEEEKERRVLDTKRAKEQRQREEEKAQQLEKERKQREKEDADRKETQLREEKRQEMERALQRSLERQEKEKMAAPLFQAPLIDPATTAPPSPLTPIEASAATAFPSEIGDMSMAMMEYEVERLLLDDSPEKNKQYLTPMPSHLPSDTNLRVRGVLESLKDPWEVQSAVDMQTAPLSCFGTEGMASFPMLSSSSLERRDSGRLGFQQPPPQSLGPFGMLRMWKQASDAKRLQQGREAAGDFGSFLTPPGQQQTHARSLCDSWSPAVAPTLTTRRSTPLDSSAPAFYPSASSELLDLQKNIQVFSTQTPSLPLVQNSSWMAAARPLDSALQRSLNDLTLRPPRSTAVEGPFPGVGAGIPGTPNRSLSERIDQRQLSLTLSEQDGFSWSGEF